MMKNIKQKGGDLDRKKLSESIQYLRSETFATNKEKNNV